MYVFRFLDSRHMFGSDTLEANSNRFATLGGRVTPPAMCLKGLPKVFTCSIHVQIIFAPAEEKIKEGHRFSVHVRPEDFTVAMCHEGMNRAQITTLVLHGVKRSMIGEGNLRVCVPHGAESGFDPYQAYKDLTDETMYGYLHGRMLPRGSPGEWVRP
jgi:hypothetical protein